MGEPHRRETSESQVCMVRGCSEPAVRSLPMKKVEGNISAGLKTEARRVQLCKAHYREYKRNTRAERITESLAWER